MMCTVIYGSKKDYRNDMQNRYSSTRAHAICRRLIATSKQMSVWYGAHYWAACAATSHEQWLGDSIVRYRDRFFREATGGDSKPTRAHEALWDLAVRRVFNIRSEALALKTSVLW